MRVLWGFYGGFMRFLWGFYRGFMGVLWGFYGGFMRVLWGFYGGFMGVLWRFFGGFLEVFWRFYRGFIRVLWRFSKVGSVVQMVNVCVKVKGAFCENFVVWLMWCVGGWHEVVWCGVICVVWGGVVW